ncbi:substrate-binding periplasmic protein [Desulfonema magnum]|nr:transporter substrate-binding domain-containing protein [Desulfonema magnum]
MKCFHEISQRVWGKSRLFFVFFLLYGNAQAQPLTVATTIDPPLVYHDEGGKLTGATVELIQEAARRLGREVSIKPVPWKRAMKYVENGVNDSVCCAGRTEERLEYLYFPGMSITSEENVWFSGNSC